MNDDVFSPVSTVLDCSCGGKRCPIVTLEDDGAVIVREDGREIVFTRENAHKLATWLHANGY